MSLLRRKMECWMQEEMQEENENKVFKRGNNFQEENILVVLNVLEMLRKVKVKMCV